MSAPLMTVCSFQTLETRLLPSVDVAAASCHPCHLLFCANPQLFWPTSQLVDVRSLSGLPYLPQAVCSVGQQPPLPPACAASPIAALGGHSPLCTVRRHVRRVLHATAAGGSGGGGGAQLPPAAHSFSSTAGSSSMAASLSAAQCAASSSIACWNAATAAARQPARSG